MSNDISYYFLPWVRYGLWKNAQKDTQIPLLGENTRLESDSSIASRIKLPIDLKLSKNKDEKKIDGINLSLYGPGDIVGIDGREIVRTEPRHLTPDFLPNLFPFIEFDRPDFPWLFTPGKPDANDCLLPWIVLVVLPKEQAAITTDPTKPSPELNCPLNELPDLKESWAWAHAQYIGLASQSLQNNQNQQDIISDELAAKPNQNVSRLICPRKLKPNEHYLACVVPSFRVIERTDQTGRVTSTLDFAWKHGKQDGDGDRNATLPVYYQWEFSTTTEGDFEDFITKLKKPGELDKKAKENFFRSMDVSSLLNDASKKEVLGIVSALAPSETQPQTQPEELSVEAKGKLIQKINDSQFPNDNAPIPIYGSSYVQNIPLSPINLGVNATGLPPWLNTLNTDPRYRVAAALGTQVIQRQQEQLMATAWERITGLDESNQIIRQKQLGMSVTNSFFKRLNKLSDTTFLQVTEPVAEAVDLANKEKQLGKAIRFHGTRSTQVSTVNLESKAVLSACCRRLLRPQSPILRHGVTSDKQPKQMKSYIKSRAVAAAVFSGTVPPDSVLAMSPNAPSVPASPVAVSAQAEEIMALLQSAESESIRTPGMGDIRIKRMNSIKPDETFRKEMRARLDKKRSDSQPGKSKSKQGEAPPSNEKDPLKLIGDEIFSFPQPMYEPLRDFFPETLIPGLDQIPNNSLVVLKANFAFIEAYMVGLNHEMSRELLWREYPTKLGSTYFKKFWDDRSGNNSLVENYEIQSWQNELGKNIRKEKEDLWMLLIKGDLLLRYPNTVIYAQSRNQQNEERKFPVLRINPVPGVTLLGFSVDLEKNAANWSFVLEEHPTETRFGLDITRDNSETLTSWRELAWTDIEFFQPNTGLKDNGHIFVKAKAIQLTTPSDIDLQSPPAPTTDPADPNYNKYRRWKKFAHERKISWGLNSAHLAYITLQKPFRYIIPSSEWF